MKRLNGCFCHIRNARASITVLQKNSISHFLWIALLSRFNYRNLRGPSCWRRSKKMIDAFTISPHTTSSFENEASFLLACWSFIGVKPLFLIVHVDLNNISLSVMMKGRKLSSYSQTDLRRASEPAEFSECRSLLLSLKASGTPAPRFFVFSIHRRWFIAVFWPQFIVHEKLAQSIFIQFNVMIQLFRLIRFISLFLFRFITIFFSERPQSFSLATFEIVPVTNKIK